MDSDTEDLSSHLDSTPAHTSTPICSGKRKSWSVNAINLSETVTSNDSAWTPPNMLEEDSISEIVTSDTSAWTPPKKVKEDSTSIELSSLAWSPPTKFGQSSVSEVWTPITANESSLQESPLKKPCISEGVVAKYMTPKRASTAPKSIAKRMSFDRHSSVSALEENEIARENLDATGKNTNMHFSKVYLKHTIIHIGSLEKFPPYLKQVPQINNDFILKKKIGQGTFGDVFLGVLKDFPFKRFAFKFLVPTSCNTAYSEIKVLQVLGQQENVISLMTSIRYQDQIVLIFPYFDHNPFCDIINSASENDIGYYMLSLLSGIAYIQKQEIIHRDIKPGNFLYSIEKRTGKLIDFGVAKMPVERSTRLMKHKVTQRHKTMTVCNHPSSSVCDVCLSRKIKRVPRAGTAGYRAPEILLGSQEQTNAIDIWSAGVILLSLLSGCYPFFSAKSDLNALAELISIFGTLNLVQVAKSLKIDLTVSENLPGTGLRIFCKGDTSLFVLLSKLLTIDPAKRIKACDALSLLPYKNY